MERYDLSTEKELTDKEIFNYCSDVVDKASGKGDIAKAMRYAKYATSIHNHYRGKK